MNQVESTLIPVLSLMQDKFESSEIENSYVSER